MHKSHREWEKQAFETHDFFCDVKHCAGIVKWDDIADVDLVVDPLRCVYANEFNLALLGIKYGIRPVDNVEKLDEYDMNNFLQNDEQYEAVYEDIKKETNKGWLRRIMWIPRYITSMFCNFEPTKVRIIKNYSSPDGASINDLTHDRVTTMMSVRSVIPMMKPFCYFAKSDLSSAFRLLAIHKSFLKYFNYKIAKPNKRDTPPPKRGDTNAMLAYYEFYNERALTWGMKCSMFYFQRLTMLARLSLMKDGYNNILVYVDDFLATEDTEDACMTTWNALNARCTDLGLTLADKADKVVAPCQRMKFLGIWLDSNVDGKGRCELQVDPAKLAKVRKMIRTLLYKNSRHESISTHELDVLIGSLVHVSQTAYAARGFYRTMIELRNSKLFNGKLSKGFVIDCRFWLREFEKYDGKALIVNKSAISNVYWATDAAIEQNFIGIGSFYDGDFISVTAKSKADFYKQLRSRANGIQDKDKNLFPSVLSGTHMWTIQYLELFAFYWALTWKIKTVRNMHIPVRIDNTNAISWLVKGTAPVPYMALLRRIQMLMFENNVSLYPVWVKSESNKLADLASRGDLTELKQLLPNWQLQVPMTERFSVMKSLYPGPLFLYGKGYLDGRIVNAWGDDSFWVTAERGIVC